MSVLRPGALPAQFLTAVEHLLREEAAQAEAVAVMTDGAVDGADSAGALNHLADSVADTIAAIDQVAAGGSGEVLGVTITSADLAQSDWGLAGGDPDAIDSLRTVADAVNNMLVSIGEDIQNSPGKVQEQYDPVAGLLGPAAAPGTLGLGVMNGMMQSTGGVIRLAPDIAAGHATASAVAGAFGGYVTSPLINQAKEKAVDAVNDMAGKLAGKVHPGGEHLVNDTNAALKVLNKFNKDGPGSLGDAAIEWAQAHSPAVNPNPSPQPEPQPGGKAVRDLVRPVGCNR